MFAPSKHHRRVIPRNVILNSTIPQQVSNHSLKHFLGRFGVRVFRKMRNRHSETVIPFCYLKPRRTAVEDRFFDKKYFVSFRKTRQKMLRTLVNEIPAQMRETDD